jgi:hypothetical protein
MKDHFSLPFIDEMLERLGNHCFFYYLDDYSGYHQIPIHLEDQSKTTFTSMYDTFAYPWMSFRLCNALAPFQRFMMVIFSDLIKKVMDDFFVYGKTFEDCLAHLDKVLKRCQEVDLVLNWDKCHFMIQNGIVLWHKISEKGIEVNKVKIEVIEQLPPPTNVKGIHSFLGNVGFYQRFIQNFFQIAQPLTHLLVKDALFIFTEEFNRSTHWRRRSSLHLLYSLQTCMSIWDQVWSSDYIVGAVLSQSKDKKHYIVSYASETLTRPQLIYTTMEKELLVVVFAIEKFKSYFVGAKVIVHTDLVLPSSTFLQRKMQSCTWSDGYFYSKNLIWKLEIRKVWPHDPG